MVAIINTGSRNDKNEHIYRLQINKHLIAIFTHKRDDGLAACLRRAADAAEQAKKGQPS